MASEGDNGTYFTQGSHTYRLLGESGLVEDEEGNILNASDLSDPYTSHEQPSSETGKVSWMNPSPGKTAPSLWDYDPRYCGPDPYTWLEERWKQHKESSSHVNQENPRNPAEETTASATTSQRDKTTFEAQSAQKEVSASDNKPQSTSDNKPQSTSDNSNPVPKPQVKIHLTKGTIIFLAIGTVAFIAYFIFLIITLVEQIARLF
ncbi:MAG: hypothetical protein K6D59_08575 [Bacteroidales bacterium]|nr:hypothetical protein [Bacteroidales bacterium]